MSFLTARADAAYRRQFLAEPETPTNFGSLTQEQRKERDEELAAWLREESRQERADQRWAE